MRGRQPATRGCIAKRRYPHLPLAQKAAASTGGAQRAALRWGCGGFHLVPTTTATAGVAGARAGARAGGVS